MIEWKAFSLNPVDAGSKPYKGDVELYKAGKDGPWPSDMIAYYDKLDDERGLPRARLCLGYKWRAEMAKKGELV